MNASQTRDVGTDKISNTSQVSSNMSYMTGWGVQVPSRIMNEVSSVEQNFGQV